MGDAKAEIVEFSVSYRVGEYRSIVLDHFRHMIGKKVGRITLFWVAVMANLAFFLKKRKMPLCEFRIDDAGISRVVNQQQLTLKWENVTAVHRYTEGYLIEKKSGALPIPYRCFNESQRGSFEVWFRARESQLAKGTE
jgi:hypothetical protein